MTGSGKKTQFVESLTEILLPLPPYVRSLPPRHEPTRDVALHAHATICPKRDDFSPVETLKSRAFSIARFKVLNLLNPQGRGTRLVIIKEPEETIAAEPIEGGNSFYHRPPEPTLKQSLELRTKETNRNPTYPN